MSNNIAYVCATYAAIESERAAGREYVKRLRELADAFEAYTESLADGLTSDVRAYETAGTDNATAPVSGITVAREFYRVITADDAVKVALGDHRAATRLRQYGFSTLP